MKVKEMVSLLPLAEISLNSNMAGQDVLRLDETCENH